MLVRLLLRFAKYLGWWLLGFLGGLLVLSFIWAQGLPDLQFWHQRSVVDEYVLELDDLRGAPSRNTLSTRMRSLRQWRRCW